MYYLLIMTNYMFDETTEWTCSSLEEAKEIKASLPIGEEYEYQIFRCEQVE